MILLKDTSWGAGREGSPTGGNYGMAREWHASRGLGYGWLGMEDGDGAGFDENVADDIIHISDPITFEHLVTNAALQITWRDK